MNGWFSKSFGDALLASEPLGQVEELFRSEYAKAGSLKEMAIFIRHESEGRLHCEVMVYFSPASVIVAREFDAGPCETPSPRGLSLFAGAEESWLALFPDSGD
ncbi:MAG: hypothetical protein L0Z73_03525 [Gammaproteobacteria bacterium]|nr:hypothetical protein [Gammaproteobacteria bacterium]